MQTVNRHRRIETNRMQPRSLAPFWLLLSALMLTFFGRTAMAQNAVLQDVEFASLPGKKVEVQLSFDSTPPDPKAYMIETPPRLVMDLWGASSALEQKMLAIKSGDIDSLHFAEANGRMRIVANLNAVVGYDISVQGNQLLLALGGQAQVPAAGAAAVSANKAAPAPRNVATAAATDDTRVTGIDFHRLDGDRGRITIDLSDAAAGMDIVEEGGNIVVQLTGANLDPALQQRLDVQDFATPVNYIDTMINGRNATILIKPTSAPYDYMAYQSGSQLVLDFQPLTPAEQANREDLFPYKGEKIDLNFQNVEIRTVLQIIAEVAEKNLVVSDNVQGDITLRLKNVPWDQALDIVLKTKGLDKREAGNVLLVGTVQEIADREAVEMQSQQQEKELAPLMTDFIQIDYRKASDIKDRVVEAKLVSERGFVMADDETNTLMVRETTKQISEIRQTVKRFDVEIEQIMVQARLVTAELSSAKDLGIRWGAGVLGGGDNHQYKIGGSPNAPSTPFVDTSDNIPGNLMVDMGVTPQSSIAFGFINNSLLLSAELSALQTDNKVDILSQPKVMTTNGKKAIIQAGQEVPVQKKEDGEVSIEYKDVVLKLEVTPQIIPGDRISMEIMINKDSLGGTLFENIIINKQELQTTVVVGDGETLVLGGILETESRNSVSKTPLLGDLPMVGGLFRKKENDAEKRELLIFITPEMIRESLRR
jgi:type IV pilus assembly protein PilQ